MDLLALRVSWRWWVVLRKMREMAKGVVARASFWTGGGSKKSMLGLGWVSSLISKMAMGGTRAGDMACAMSIIFSSLIWLPSKTGGCALPVK